MLLRIARFVRSQPAATLIAGLFLIGAGYFGSNFLRWRLEFSALETAYRNEDYPEAARLANRCYGLRPDHLETTIYGIRIARITGNFDKAETFLNSWVKRNRDKYNERLQLEYLLLRAVAGEFDEVEDGLMAELRRGSPESPEICRVLTRVYLKQLKFNAALWVAERWIEYAPDSASAHFMSAWIHEQVNRSDAAESHFRTAIELGPDRPEYRVKYVEFLLVHNRVSDALGQSTEAVRRSPDDPDTLTIHARVLSAAGRSDDAIPLLRSSIGRQPTALACTELSKLESERKNFAAAEAAARQALGLDPFDPQSHFALYQSLRTDPARHAEAQACLDRYREIERDSQRLAALVRNELPARPNSSSLMVELGEILLRMGQTEVALRWLDNALVIDPDQIRAHQLLADYHRSKGNVARAAVHEKYVSAIGKSKKVP
jgi:tetratricopeptide (TPR) repeat protein